jgi:hypothetical protein
MKKLFPYPWYESFWFSWLAFTAIYLSLVFAGGLADPQQGSILGYITGFFGLFSPIGVFSFLFSVVTKGMPLCIVAVFLLGVDAFAARFAFGPKKKIFFNVGVLMFLTLLVDLAIYGSWLSLAIFLGGGMKINPAGF